MQDQDQDQDLLNLTFQQSTLLFPSQQTHHHHKTTFFLSNIDQSLINFNVRTLHFFSPNPDFPPETVADMLKLAIEKVLVPYDFMAGRLKWNHLTARHDLLCNSAGAGFLVASSAFSLHEIGDLDCPNPGFRLLAVPTLDSLDEHQPLCVFQLTSFKCGGFAFGMSVNHVLFDGSAAGMFLKNLASQAFQDKPLAVIPCHDRRLLAARSPPLVSFPHPEFLKPPLPVLGPPVYGSKQELEIKVFKISSSDINFLKAKAAKQAAADNATALKITGFNVMAALIWRCRALSLCDVEGNKDRVFTLCYAVDLRSRLNPPLPPEYCGNAVLPGYASAKCRDVEKWSLSKLVEMILEGIERMRNEYVKSAIDWLEINKGIPYGDCLLTSLSRLGLDEVVFPWGKALNFGLVMNNLERLCWMLPHVDGVKVLIQGPAAEMERFDFHLHNFFVA